MNKKLIFICEGYTELAFCEQILKEHFLNYQIDVEGHLISHSNGGIVKWNHLKKQIENTVEIIKGSFVTTFIDFYGLEHHHDFPKWTVAYLEANKADKMEILEKAMSEDISLSIKNNFIPYIQIHEFEAYVFSNFETFEDYYMEDEADFKELEKICNQHPNPEDINDNLLTAPSKRLINSIKRYDKITHGVEICKEIGLEKIRKKCVRFNSWINTLENI